MWVMTLRTIKKTTDVRYFIGGIWRCPKTGVPLALIRRWIFHNTKPPCRRWVAICFRKTPGLGFRAFYSEVFVLNDVIYYPFHLVAHRPPFKQRQNPGGVVGNHTERKWCRKTLNKRMFRVNGCLWMFMVGISDIIILWWYLYSRGSPLTKS